ncbi:MAG: DUF3168 domain-containing protein [Planctomycetota bacterium]
MILHHIRSLLISAINIEGEVLYADRVYSGQAPQDATTPYLVQHLISQTNGHTHDGPNDFVTGRLQINCFAGTYELAHDLAAQVNQQLDGAKAAAAISTVKLIYIERDRTYDLPTPTPMGRELPIEYGVGIDYRFAHHA